MYRVKSLKLKFQVLWTTICSEIDVILTSLVILMNMELIIGLRCIQRNNKQNVMVDKGEGKNAMYLSRCYLHRDDSYYHIH